MEGRVWKNTNVIVFESLSIVSILAARLRIGYSHQAFLNGRASADSQKFSAKVGKKVERQKGKRNNLLFVCKK
jgi:hypothetical protein